MMKTKGVVLLLLFSLLLCGSAAAYETAITGNIYVEDKIDAISVNPDTGIAAAVSSSGKALYIIDVPASIVINKISLKAVPTGVAIDSKRNLAIVSSKEGALHFIDIETGSLIKTGSAVCHSGPDPESILAISTNNASNILYIGSGSCLAAMDLETGNNIKETSLSGKIIGMAIDYTLNYLAVIIEGKEGLSIYNTETLEPIKSGIWNPPVPIISGASGIGINPSTHIAVLTDKSGNSVTFVSLEQMNILDKIQILDEPYAVAVDPSGNSALISHKRGIAVIQLENPVPSIEKLIPESSDAGSSGIALSIRGSKFIRDSKVRFNLKDVNSMFEDNYNLLAYIPSAELSSPGEVPVAVQNPPPAGGLSNSLMFRIMNPMPKIESITPDTVTLTYKNEIKIRGKNFLPNSIVNLNGKNLKTKFISSILLEATADLTDIKTPAKYPVTVINPSLITFTSNVVFLNVVENQSQTPNAKNEGTAKSESAGAPGTLIGRILNTEKQPVEGVTVKIKNISSVTDSDGYFILNNAPSGKQIIVIHGSTAIEQDSRYPTIPLTINIEPDTINDMPF
ncbi:MAG: IPT/TIG domain-containing protein [Thermodesulfovibrionales bacterium]|nr:IPT/TIG domain-containing protein [Thermodesulfovibrionales bacterium]